MQVLMLWLSFIGSWLLFAGPIYQAALELMNEEIEGERIKAAGAKVGARREVSRWWWLLPPVKLWLESHSTTEYRRAYAAVLLPEDVEALIGFMNKASAWVMVAAGGLLVAVKSTYDLTKNYRLNVLIFLAAALVMAFFGIMNTVLRVKRGIKIVRKYKPSQQ